MIEVYAELSKKQYKQIQAGEAYLQVPSGVDMKNRAGSRALYFYCNDEETAELLKEGLDDSFIAWQDN
jgi:hypothetical protein